MLMGALAGVRLTLLMAVIATRFAGRNQTLGNAPGISKRRGDTQRDQYFQQKALQPSLRLACIRYNRDSQHSPP